MLSVYQPADFWVRCNQEIFVIVFVTNAARTARSTTNSPPNPPASGGLPEASDLGGAVLEFHGQAADGDLCVLGWAMELELATPEQVLRWAHGRWGAELTLATSFQAEGMILFICAINSVCRFAS